MGQSFGSRAEHVCPVAPSPKDGEVFRTAMRTITETRGHNTKS